MSIENRVGRLEKAEFEQEVAEVLEWLQRDGDTFDVAEVRLAVAAARQAYKLFPPVAVGDGKFDIEGALRHLAGVLAIDPEVLVEEARTVIGEMAS